MKIKQTWPAILGVILLIAALLISPVFSPAAQVSGAPAEAVQAAPAAVPTPITQSAFNPAPKMAEFWAAGSTITADTRVCADSTGYSVLDLHYILDQTTVNTTTITIEYSNIRSGYTDALLYPDGVAVVTANAADAADMKQFHVFGGRTCLIADVANTNSLGIAGVGEFK